ncbi:MAG: hypothetical protein HC811_09370 [Flammeovirgaceae bacterium]|nr:hypothetical protein [Flammeovirgaceae bacterium]
MSSSAETAAEISKERLGDNFESFLNETGEFLLCVQNTSQSTINGTLRFVVIDVTHGQVVVEKIFRPGYVRWHSKQQLELQDLPGIAKENEDPSTYIKLIQIGKSNE